MSSAPSRLRPNVRLAAWLAGLFSWLPALAGDQPPAALPCATSRAELKAHDLAEVFLKQRGKLELKSALGCLKLESGMELPAVLLALPPLDSPYSIRIAAPTQRSFYLQPRIEMLDAQYQPLRSYSAERLKRRGTELSLEVFMNGTNAAERFVLLYADPEHLADTDQKTTSQSRTLFVGTGFVIVGDDKTASLRSVTEGGVTVQLLGEQWEKALRAARNRGR
jgi:hypothetical protein